MRKVIAMVGVALVVVVGVAAAASSKSSQIAAHNRAAARRDAAKHLAAVSLPAGATRTASEPKGDNEYLKAQGILEVDRANVVTHGWWVLSSGTPDAVTAYVEAHRPAGSAQFATGTTGNGRTGTSAESVSFQWPSVGDVLGYRELTVTATALRDGKTGVLVEAQSDWIVPRPSNEVVPAGVHEIDVTGGKPGATPTVSLAVSDPTKVGRIIRIINGLAAEQPIVYACPLERDPRQVTLTFRGGAGGPALATLEYTVFGPDYLQAGWACDSYLDFTIGGVTQPALAGGRLLPKLQSVLGVSLV